MIDIDTPLYIVHLISVLSLSALGLGVFKSRLDEKTKRLLVVVVLIICFAISIIIYKREHNAREADKIAAQEEREADRARCYSQSLEREKKYAPKELVRATPPPVSGQVEILSPGEGVRVTDRITIRGSLSGTGGKVWLVVHPVGIASYWVQPQINLRADGRWSGRAYIGRAGMDTDQAFEILAVVDPEKSLTEGDVLDSWPMARWSSQVVEVIRK